MRAHGGPIHERIAKLEQLIALSNSGGAIAAIDPVFVIRPAGPVNAPNVYTTWPALMAAVGEAQGPKWIEVNGTVNVPAGTWNLQDCNLCGSGNFTDTLNFTDGAHINSSLQLLRISGTLVVNNTGTTPTLTATSSVPIIFVTEAATLNGGASAPFVDVPNGAIIGIELQQSSLGDGIHSVMRIDAGGTGDVTAYGQSTINSNAFSGAVLPNLFVSDDSGAPILSTTIYESDAARVDYHPVNAGHWNPVPTVVGGTAALPSALDAIVNPNFTFAQVGGAPVTPFSSLALGSNLTRKRAGLFRISASVSGTSTADEVVIVTLVRDGTTVIGPTLKFPAAPIAGGHAFGGSITVTDQITDTAAHTWSVNAVGSGGGTLTVGAAGAYIEACEQ